MSFMGGKDFSSVASSLQGTTTDIATGEDLEDRKREKEEKKLTVALCLLYTTFFPRKKE
jgi:hypothetical protein